MLAAGKASDCGRAVESRRGGAISVRCEPDAVPLSSGREDWEIHWRRSGATAGTLSG